jgi:hypothetical protein
MKKAATYLGNDVTVTSELHGRAQIRYATRGEWIEHWVDIGDLVYTDGFVDHPEPAPEGSQDDLAPDMRLVEFRQEPWARDMELKFQKIREALETVLDITMEGLGDGKKDS